MIVPTVENIDLSHIIKRHTDYNTHFLAIIRSLEIDDLAVVQRDHQSVLLPEDCGLVFDEEIRHTVLDIYREHNPSKTEEEIHKICAQYQGREEELLRKLRYKYVDKGNREAREGFRVQVLALYREHNPYKPREEIERLFREHRGREEELLRKVRQKYVVGASGEG